MANPITQADGGSSLAKLWDTVGSNSGGPNAEIEADRILLFHEMGSVLSSERFLTRGRDITSGAVAQNTAWDVNITGLSNGPCRLCSIYLAIETPGTAAEIDHATINLRNNDTPSDEIVIFAWDTTVGTVVRARTNLDTGTTATQLVLVNMLPYQELLINGNSRGVQNTFDALSFRGLTAGFGAGTRTVRGYVRVVTMDNPAGVDNTGSYGLPLYW